MQSMGCVFISCLSFPGAQWAQDSYGDNITSESYVRFWYIEICLHLINTKFSWSINERWASKQAQWRWMWNSEPSDSQTARIPLGLLVQEWNWAILFWLLWWATSFRTASLSKDICRNKSRSTSNSPQFSNGPMLWISWMWFTLSLRFENAD